VPQPDESTLAIARILEVDWKIATFQGQPDEENRVAVIVAVREPRRP
jgi:hypothetical protein